MVDCETTSNSGRSVWRECRYKYACRYPRRLEALNPTDDSAAEFGKYIHRIFELGIRARTLEELLAIALSERSNYKITQKFKPKVVPCLKNFLKLNKRLQYKGDPEYRYRLELAPGYFDRGVIDRVVKGPAGSLLIIDYKTGKRQKTKAQLFEDTQGQDYTYAAHRIFGVDVKKIHFAHYYPIDDTIVPVTYRPEMLAKNVKSNIKDMQNIRGCKVEDMRPNQNQFCNWCDFKSGCEIFNPPLIVEDVLKKAKKRPKRKYEEEKTHLYPRLPDETLSEGEVDRG